MTKSKLFHALFAKRNLQQNLTWKDTENLCIRMKKKIELFVYIIKNFKPIFIRTGRRIPPPLPLETLKIALKQWLWVR